MRKRITSLLLSMVMVSGLLFTAMPVHASEEGVEPDTCEHVFSLAEASERAVMTPGTCVNIILVKNAERLKVMEIIPSKEKKILKSIICPMSGKVIIPDTGMNVRTAKKNWILLYIFRTMKGTLRKIMQLPVRYVDG